MKIGVLSDTHIPYAAAALPKQVLDILATMDAIIHAGDYQDAALIETLTTLAPFYGVAGNMDGGDVRALVPEKKVVCLGGFSIGIIHGWGSSHRLEDRVVAAFADAIPDVIVYGHSHNPSCTIKDTTLLFNPGSPTDQRYARFNSIGVLTLGEKVDGEIIRI